MLLVLGVVLAQTSSRPATTSFNVPGWMSVVTLAIGVVGAVAFLLAYGDRKRLQSTIESYATTVSAYKDELTVTKSENQALRAQVGECQGAIRVLTETVTQSAKVEMLAHSTEAQHRAILDRLAEMSTHFEAVASRITAA